MSQERILVIDNQPATSRFFHTIFSYLRKECHAVESLSKALDVVPRFKPNLILVRQRGQRDDVRKTIPHLTQQTKALLAQIPIIQIGGTSADISLLEDICGRSSYQLPLPFDIVQFRNLLFSLKFIAEGELTRRCLILEKDSDYAAKLSDTFLQAGIAVQVLDSDENLENQTDSYFDLAVVSRQAATKSLETINKFFIYQTGYKHIPLFYIGQKLTDDHIHKIMSQGFIDVFHREDGAKQIGLKVIELFQKLQLRQNDVVLYSSWRQEEINIMHYTCFKHGFNAICCNSTKTFLQTLHDFDIDLIALGSLEENINPVKLSRHLKDKIGHIPLIVSTKLREHNFISRLFHAGVNDCLVAPYFENEMISRIETHIRLKKSLLKLEEKNRILETLSLTDNLTGLYNRRYMEIWFPKEQSKAEEQGYAIGFCLIDIDHFKKINDSYGHLVGDQVISQLARLLSSNNRLEDLIVRYGGEEIAILMPRTNTDEILHRANHYRILIADHVFQTKNATIHITVSIGATVKTPDQIGDIKTMAHTADNALYECKNLGRNQVVVLPLIVPD